MEGQVIHGELTLTITTTVILLTVTAILKLPGKLPKKLITASNWDYLIPS